MTDAVQLAAYKLNNGDIIGLPTETVYGLAADARNPTAVRKIYEIKNRPITHPLITHIAKGANIFAWANAERIELNTRTLIEKIVATFWPGPLTLVLPKASHIDATVTGGQDTIALRCPAHPLAQAVLHELSILQSSETVGIAAPSANHFGRVSPTCAEHVRDEFGDMVWILDGQISDVGIESTIIDLTRNTPTILRLGHITAEDIANTIGIFPLVQQKMDTHAPRVSGTLSAHYAPNTKLIWASEYTKGDNAVCLCYSPNFDATNFISHIRLPTHALGYAKGMYHALRELDRLNASCIIVEDLPSDIRWDAIRDRLYRAVVGSNEVQK